MGRVLRARHRTEVIAQRQGGDVAVKVMHPNLAAKPNFRERFEQEATVGLRLSHPGIVKVHDLVVDGDVLALVMDLVDGLPLNQVFAGRKVPESQVGELVRQIAEALHTAHEAGVVHRDLKPANVMLDGGGRARVLDFGIAKEHGGGQGTRTGTGMGTIAYMAPEQYRDAKRVDRRADVYALAMMAYEMLAGQLPWNEPVSEFDLLRRKAEGQLDSVRMHVPELGGGVEEVLRMGLAMEPDSRFLTTLAFSTALNTALSPDGPLRIEELKSPPKAPPSPPARPSNETLHLEGFLEEPEPQPPPPSPTPKKKATRRKGRRQLAKDRGTDGLAIASFVVSLISALSCLFPFSALAVVMGIISAWRINSRPERYTGGGLAAASIVMGVVGTMSGGMLFLIVMAENL